MDKIELSAPLVVKIYEILNSLPRVQVNGVCGELERQIAEHNAKQPEVKVQNEQK